MNERILFKWIFEKCGVNMLAVFFWPRCAFVNMGMDFGCP